MLAVDTSILVGLLKGEQDVLTAGRLLVSTRVFLSSGALIETHLWLVRNGGSNAVEWLDRLMGRPNVVVSAMTVHMTDHAISAVRRFGRGSGHPARLNFGDCMVYGHAKALDLPLLFKGADFGLTDVQVHPAAVLVS